MATALQQRGSLSTGNNLWKTDTPADSRHSDRALSVAQMCRPDHLKAGDRALKLELELPLLGAFRFMRQLLNSIERHLIGLDQRTLGL
jgi:hypothetical protein